MADWANDISSYNSQTAAAGSNGGGYSTGGGGGGGSVPVDEIASRTANVAAQLKKIYRKSVLPVEKRYKYDFFYESPLLTDVEFDCTYSF